jgi:hypothetical protein
MFHHYMVNIVLVPLFVGNNQENRDYTVFDLAVLDSFLLHTVYNSHSLFRGYIYLLGIRCIALVPLDLHNILDHMLDNDPDHWMLVMYLPGKGWYHSFPIQVHIYQPVQKSKH